MKQDFDYILIIGITLLGAFVVSETLRRLIRRFVNVNASKIKVDPTNYSFLRNATSFVIYSIAIIFIIYTVPRFRALGTTLFAGAGIFAAIIALASQQAFSNIISGIFIVISKPFRVGDYIVINDNHKGTVEDVTLRHTVIQDIQNNRIIVPNATINAETIINFNLKDERKREKIEFDLDLESDIDKAMSIMQEECRKHPYYLHLSEEQEGLDDLKVRVTNIGNGSMTLRINVNSPTPDKGFEMHCDLNYQILKRFKNEGIIFEKRVGMS